MADRVIYSNLFSEFRENILALISDTSNVSDPVSSSSEHRKFIYSRNPDIKDSNFKGYPYIIIHPSDVDTIDGGSLDGASKFMDWSIEIDIVTSDRGYGKNDGLGLSHMDTLSNSIMTTLLNTTNRQTLRTNALFFGKPTTTAVVTEVNADELIYRRSIMVDFRSRIQISA